MIDKENQKETYVPDASKIIKQTYDKFVFRGPSLEDGLEVNSREISKLDNRPFEEVQCMSPSPQENHLVDPQPMPTKNNEPFMWDLVINEVMLDMRFRDEFGAKKYNTRLQPNTNRDALKDAYQEALDLVVYLRTVIYERDGR